MLNVAVFTSTNRCACPTAEVLLAVFLGAALNPESPVSQGPGAERAGAGSRRLPLWEVPGSRCHLSGCPGAGHRERPARHPLRPAFGHRRVRAPHRAHRPLREHRQGALLLRSRVRPALGPAAGESAVRCKCEGLQLRGGSSHGGWTSTQKGALGSTLFRAVRLCDACGA